MPVYCYTSKGGYTQELKFERGKAPDKVEIDGLILYRNYQFERVQGIVKNAIPSRVSRGKAKWPMEPCVGSGVNANQAQELRDFLAKSGVPTEVTNDGDPIYTSPEHRRKALKARGLYDKSSFN